VFLFPGFLPVAQLNVCCKTVVVYNSLICTYKIKKDGIITIWGSGPGIGLVLNHRIDLSTRCNVACKNQETVIMSGPPCGPRGIIIKIRKTHVIFPERIYDVYYVLQCVDITSSRCSLLPHPTRGGGGRPRTQTQRMVMVLYVCFGRV